jgi:hypothetical protein
MDIYTQIRILVLEAILALVEEGVIPADLPEVAKIRAELRSRTGPVS